MVDRRASRPGTRSRAADRGYLRRPGAGRPNTVGVPAGLRRRPGGTIGGLGGQPGPPERWGRDCRTACAGRGSGGAAEPPGEARSPVVAAKVRVPPMAALPRERLHALLAAVWERRLAVVVAPAGSGKTTLLADFATASGVPVAWYRAEIVGRGRARGPAPPRSRARVDPARPAPGLAERRRGRLGARGAARRAGVSSSSTTRTGSRARPAEAGPRPVHRVRAGVARDRRRIAAAAGLQPVAAARRRRAARDRSGRPPVPGLGGRAPVPRPLPRPCPARRPRRARPPDGGLGRRPPALPPRDARQVGRRAAADPVGGRAPAAGSSASTSPGT